MADQNLLAETFAINNRINLYLLQAINEEHLPDVYSGGKGRTVGKQWAHMHQVRMMWLKSAAPDLLDGLSVLTDIQSLKKEALRDALTSSGTAVEKLFQQSAVSGKIKGFKPHPTAFLGYLLSHEGHHRGQILVTLKQNGHMVDKKTQFGLWEWGSR